jgi:hypothetical protein
MLKKYELANEIVRFNEFFPLIFFNELNNKCIVWFGGFVKIMDPWQLMGEINFEISSIIKLFIICS